MAQSAETLRKGLGSGSTISLGLHFAGTSTTAQEGDKVLRSGFGSSSLKHDQLLTFATTFVTHPYGEGKGATAVLPNTKIQTSRCRGGEGLGVSGLGDGVSGFGFRVSGLGSKHPAGQVQVKLPSVSAQIASSSQLSLSLTHSS
jgi:hypothetical protein